LGENAFAMPQQDAAVPIVSASSETPTISPENTPKNHRTHDITPEQAVVLLQHYADSLFDDYRKRLANGEYNTRSAAEWKVYENKFYVPLYMYYLMAHLMDENTNIALLYQSVSPPMIEDRRRYDKILDSMSLNQDESYQQWLERETSIRKKREPLSQEIQRLNNWYLIGCSDSILYHTRKYFPSCQRR
jgi:hypothetical protein